jgi:pyruvate dehydrogenase E1 component
VGVLTALARRGEVDRSAVVEATRKYQLGDVSAAGPQTSDPGSA